MIEILDSFFAKKDILRKYTYAQYIDCFREVGTFEIHAQLVDENIYLLDKTEQYYVLFYDGNKPILGKIEDVKRESDEQYDIVIKLTGRLAPVLFTQRVINGTQKFSGKTYQRVQTLVNSNLIQSDKTERNVDITINLLNETVMQEKASQEDKQVTGGYVWDEMQGSLETDSFGIDFYPVLSTPTGEHKTNIASWVLDISPGNDRRKGNVEGNMPVVFSQQLSNIERTDYDRNVKNHKNVAYVAGEGEDNDRKWYEIDINQDIEQKLATGWGRKELWIDARDIQSKDEDGTDLTETEYEALITQRANEKAADNTVQETYEATKTEGDTRYQYGVDFFKGDWVTVEDRNLNIVVDAQITKVTHTIQGTREIIDITFSYGQIDKDPVEQIGGNLDKTEQNSNDIKYLENKKAELSVIVEMLTRRFGTLTAMVIGSQVLNEPHITYRSYMFSLDQIKSLILKKCRLIAKDEPDANKCVVLISNGDYGAKTVPLYVAEFEEANRHWISHWYGQIGGLYRVNYMIVYWGEVERATETEE